jgi:hypothetical protein
MRAESIIAHVRELRIRQLPNTHLHKFKSGRDIQHDWSILGQLFGWPSSEEFVTMELPSLVEA